MATISFSGANYGAQIGENRGIAHFYPPERPDTPPAPLSTVPFRRDPDFVDRGILLNQLQDSDSMQNVRIALVGLGGVGKSQLAIEYCHRIRHRSSATWVFWIHASNAARFEQSCWEIADRAKITGRQNPQANIFKLLSDWLNDAKARKWVIVLDNLDNAEFLHTTSSVLSNDRADNQNCLSRRSIWSYFNQSSGGLIMITSRRRRVALTIVEDYEIIPVEPMEEIHAISLIEKKIGLHSDHEEIVQLAAALDFIPLAIVQATSFIKQRAPRESIKKYLERFWKSDNKKIHLLDHEGGQLRRDPGAKNSTLRTWEISFDDIRQIKPSAAHLLCLMSFFGKQGIPDRLLHESKAAKYYAESLPAQNLTKKSDENEGEDDLSVFSEGEDFEDDISILRDFSLIHIGADNTSFEMHRLVQLGMHKWMKVQNIFECWNECYIRLLYRNFPEGVFENWKKCQTLFAHVQCAVRQKPHGVVPLEEWASLLHNTGSYARTRGNSVYCREMALTAMRTRESLFGPEDKETLSSSRLLGQAYSLERRWQEAEELQLHVIRTSERVLGRSHPDTLASMADLAVTYVSRKFWNKAVQLSIQVIKVLIELLGLEHLETLRSIANLAAAYFGQGHWNEAGALYIQVTEARKRVLGLHHPATLASMASLAATIWNQGRQEEAEELNSQVFEARMQVLGPKHPETLGSMADVAAMDASQRQFEEGDELNTQVAQSRGQIVGPYYPASLISVQFLCATAEHERP